MVNVEETLACLRAGVARDEQAARGTRQASPSWRNFDMPGELRDDANAGTVAFVPFAEDRAHMARQDPRRTLDRVDAYQKVIEIADWLVTTDERWAISAGEEIVAALADIYSKDDPSDEEAWWRGDDG